MCDIDFEKVKGCGRKVNRASVYAEAVYIYKAYILL